MHRRASAENVRTGDSGILEQMIRPTMTNTMDSRNGTRQAHRRAGERAGSQARSPQGTRPHLLHLVASLGGQARDLMMSRPQHAEP